MTTKTYELPAGSEVSVRTNESIDSATAAEGQTFEAQVTRDAKDANGDIVIPRGSSGKIVIKSASKGGRFKGASDLVLDLQSVTINGKQYSSTASDVRRREKPAWGQQTHGSLYRRRRGARRNHRSDCGWRQRSCDRSSAGCRGRGSHSGFHER